MSALCEKPSIFLRERIITLSLGLPIERWHELFFCEELDSRKKFSGIENLISLNQPLNLIWVLRKLTVPIIVPKMCPRLANLTLF
jgi:hypothetical protein